MCAPIALGVASFATGALGAVGQHQSASAQASAANAAATSNYKYQLKMRERSWDRERYRYGQQLHQYNMQTQENYSAAQKAYSSEQRRLNEIFRKAAFDQQGMLTQVAGSQGKMTAAGRSGRSADRINNSLLSAYGRNQAIQAESLLSAQNAYTAATGTIRDQLRNSNRDAFNAVAINPQPGIAPPPPVMQQGPSGIGLMSGLLSAGVSGFQTYNNLKAPTTAIPTI